MAGVAAALWVLWGVVQGVSMVVQVLKDLS